MKLAFSKRNKDLPLKYEVWYITGLIACFVAIAMATIGVSSVWFDEAFGDYMIRFSYLDIFRYTAADVHPPLYYWALKTWSLLFGTSDIALRSLSVVFACVALVFAYLLLRRLFGQRTAMITLPFVALSPMLVRYAQEMRMYTMVLAIAMAGTYALVLALDRPTKRRWVIYGILVAMGMWTHYFMALVWLGHWAWRAIDTRERNWKRWWKKFFTKDWVLTHCLAVALFVPWLPWAVKQFLDVQVHGFWIPPISPVTIPAYLTNFALYLTTSEIDPWQTVLLGVMTAFCVAVIIATWRRLKGEERRGYQLLLVGAITPVLLLIVLSLPPLRSTFMDRYLLASLTMLAMAIGVALVRAPWPSVRLRWVGGAALILTFCLGISHVYHYGNYNQFDNQKSETKQIVMMIRATPGTTGQPIVANSPWLYYEAAPYATASNGIYFINKNVQYIYGSLAMLQQNDLGKIKDLDAFLRAHPTFWYIGRTDDQQMVAPSPRVRVRQILYLNDEITGQPAYQAVQYEVIAG